MASRSVILRILGDSRSLQRALNTVDAQGKKTGKSFGLLGKTAKLAAGAGGLYAVQRALTSTVNAAKEAQVSQRKMQTQLKALGISYEDHAGQIEKTIQAQSKLSALDDEDLQDSFTNLVRTTGNVTKALELNALAADIARAKNISLETASRLVGKVYAGNTSALARYGIQIDKGATSTEALGILQQRFAGQAEAYGKSAAGAADRYHVALENLQELIGGKLLPTLTSLLGVFTRMIDLMTRNSAIAKVLGGVVVALTTAVIANKIATASAAAVTRTWAAAQAALNLVMKASPVWRLAAVLLAIGAALVYAYRHNEKFRNSVNGTAEALRPLLNMLITTTNAVYGLINALNKIKGPSLSDIKGPSLLDVLHRQHGGPVAAGHPYMVGERGPELFVPGRSGTIVPNGAGGAMQVNLVLDRKVLASVLVDMNAAHMKQNGGRPIFAT